MAQVLAVMPHLLTRHPAQAHVASPFWSGNMTRSALLPIVLCALLASCAHPPQPTPVAAQSPAKATAPHRARRVATANVKRTAPPSKATPAGTQALSCLEKRSGNISEARTDELFAEFDNREHSGADVPTDISPVSRACP